MKFTTPTVSARSPCTELSKVLQLACHHACVLTRLFILTQTFDFSCCKEGYLAVIGHLYSSFKFALEDTGLHVCFIRNGLQNKIVVPLNSSRPRSGRGPTLAEEQTPEAKANSRKAETEH
jgi:hypothetical protein